MCTPLPSLMRGTVPAMFACLVLAISWFSSVPSSYGSASWPNEPSNAGTIVDVPFNSLPSGGMYSAYNNYAIVGDSTAPLSPSNVIQFTRPPGQTGGDQVFTALPNMREVYLGFWWKPSNPFDGWLNNSNKLIFLKSPVLDNIVENMYGPRGGNRQLAFILQLTTDNCHLPTGFGDCPGTYVLLPNASSGITSLGQWHRIEVYVKHSTTRTSRDGILRWWVDGVLAGNFTTVNFQIEPWNEMHIVQAWDSPDPTQTSTDRHWFDHLRISQPGGSTATDQPPGPPATPTIRSVTVP